MFRRNRLNSAIALAIALAGCQPPEPPPPGAEIPLSDDPSIVYIKAERDEDNYRRGVANDQAALNVDPRQTLVIPDTATVERGGPSGNIGVYMAKETEVGGQPAPDSDELIRGARASLGCVRRVEDGKVILAAYGELGDIEFARSVRLLLRVPEGQPMETRADLTGATKYLGSHHRESPRHPGEDGWEAIPDQSDPTRRAHGTREDWVPGHPWQNVTGR